MPEYLAIVFVLALVGSAVGGLNERPGLGFMLGFAFGPVGWLVVLFIGKPDNHAHLPKAFPNFPVNSQLSYHFARPPTPNRLNLADWILAAILYPVIMGGALWFFVFSRD